MKRYVAAALAVAVVACAGRTAPTSAAVSSYAGPNNEPGVAPKWSLSGVRGRAVAIADGAVIVQTGRLVNRQNVYGIAGYDIGSGKELWRREGPQSLRGSPQFFAEDGSIERVNLRTGDVLWRSREVCARAIAYPQAIAYVKAVEGSVYAGCAGGALFRLDPADGRVLASQDPISVDDYQRIVPLPHATLAVAGYASIGMYALSAILHERTLEPVAPAGTFTADLNVLGIYNDEAIVADVCCRGTPDTNSPGAILGVSLQNGDIHWSVAIRPYHPPLPLSDVEPGAGVFALAGGRLYVGTRTALFVYRIGDLRADGAKASRRELYSDLRDRPQLYDGRYLGISEGQDATVRRSALFDTMTGRELWSDASRPWSTPPGAPQTLTAVEMYAVTPGDRHFALLRLSDGKMLPIDTGCYLQAADERYAVALCGKRGRLPELALFDFDSAETAPPEAPVAPTAATVRATPETDAVLARWTGHSWGLAGSTAETYFFGRNPNGVVAVNRKSGTIAWQNRTICSGVTKAAVVNEILYAACPSTVAILRRADGHVAHEQSVGIYGFNAIVPAGERAVVVEGWNDGAALSTALAILDKNTLHPITNRELSDSTFLGVIGDRAYIDDWCCFGRPDQYRPATIYSISLEDGSASEPIDLYPEPDLHPAREQPLGQGEQNYLKGGYFYVVTTSYTYRYDVRNLDAPPVRSVTSSATSSKDSAPRP